VFAAIDEMPPVEQGERMDALLEIVGDAEEQETAHRQVVEFLESRELPPCGYVTAAVEGVYMYGGMRGARTLFAWARESVGRPGARYAAIPHAIELRSDFSREEAEEAGFDLDDAFAPLRGDDPIAALLAVSSLADLHHRGFSAEGWHSKSNRERALVAEAIRRGASRRKD
ncbi:MAG TPA: hypothetical protein VGE52_00570, partial [Pirellulales bacterium]